MEQTIKLQGHTAQPSDYLCPDGELAVCMNAVPGNGELKYTVKPETILLNNIGGGPIDIRLIHKVDVKENLLFVTPSSGAYTLRYIVDYRRYSSFQEAAPQSSPIHTFESNILDCRAVGNILVINSEDCVEYVRWDGTTYSYLGPLPELPDVSLGLDLKCDRGNTKIYYDYLKNPTAIISPEDETKRITDNTNNLNKLLGGCNKIVGQFKEDFCYPFFIRYAYELYDGTLVKHSAPILMIPTSGPNPTLYADYANISGATDGLWSYHLIPQLIHARLLYRINSLPGQLANFKDIITRIVFYVSAPLYTYEQGMSADDFVPTELTKDHNIPPATVYDATIKCYGMSTQLADTLTSGGEKYRKFGQIPYHIISGIWQSPNPSGGLSIFFPPYDSKKTEERVRNCSTFYKYAEITVENLQLQSGSKNFHELQKLYPGQAVSEVTVNPAMPDDVSSHLCIKAGTEHVYNGRLHMADLTKTLFRGFGITESMNFLTDREKLSTGEERLCDVYVYIRKNGSEYMVKYDGSSYPAGLFKAHVVEGHPDTYENFPLHYFYYPDPDAYKVDIIPRYDLGGIRKLSIQLKRHNFLHGAYYFSNFITDGPITEADKNAPRTVKNILKSPNQCYVSEVNNPLVFNPQFQFTVGNGRIIGLSSAAKAMSQGQFGQFPLYAFTDEGVWAIEVSSQGTYSSRSPFTRDVCIAPSSITQLDGEVAFFSARGIMLLSGSTSTCISDIISKPFMQDTLLPFHTDNLPHITELAAKVISGVGKNDIVIRPFMRYIIPSASSGISSGMVYDYLNQRLIVYNSSAAYSYVFSMESRKWGMLMATVDYTLNSYPEAYAVRKGSIINFATRNDGKSAGGQFIVTRPFKFGSADSYKTLRSVFLRGNFTADSVKFMALYGSTDGRRYLPVKGSSDYFINGFSGTPYKSFILAFGITMQEGDSVSSFTVDVVSKLTGRIK